MSLTITPLHGIGEVVPGDSVADLLADALRRAELEPADGDVLVVTHKIVSKAEGRVAHLGEDEEAGYRALVEREARSILRRRGALVIAETEHGFVCANAGVDRSNAPAGTAVTLPSDPDASAHGIRARLERLTGKRLAVMITDTFGRAWRRGLSDVAIGVSGMPALLDLRGTRDTQGRVLEVTEVAVADEVAAAADLVMGKANGVPAALVRGLDLPAAEGRATDLIRHPGEDLFR